MGPAERLKQILDGDLQDLSSAPRPESDAAGIIAAVTDLANQPLTFEQCQAMVGGFLARGEILKALTLIKVLAAIEQSDEDMRSGPLTLLEEALLVGTDENGEATTTDPLAREFLGSDRIHIAWSVLQRDRLEFAPIPNETGRFGASAWVVCQDERHKTSQAPHGYALVWWSTTKVAGKLRPAGHRRTSRQKLPLQGRLFFLGNQQPTGRFDVEFNDLSETGVGLSIVDRYGRVDPDAVAGRRVRLEIIHPSGGDSLTTLAIIRWGRPAKKGEEGTVTMGIQFYDPLPEFTESVSRLLLQGKGDQQYLWNLWKSQTTKG